MSNNRLKQDQSRVATDTKMVAVPFQLFEKIVNNLTAQPYRQVAPLIEELSRCEAVKEPVAESPEPTDANPKG